MIKELKRQINQLQQEISRTRMVLAEKDAMNTYIQSKLQKWKGFDESIKAMTGESLESLVPNHLSDKMLKKYNRIFVGFIRTVGNGNNVVPNGILKIISSYYTHL